MRKPTLFVLFLIVFVDLVGFGIVLLLPLYSEKLGASGLMIGCIVASYNLMQFFFAPWLGKLSDRIGRRPIILLSTAGSAISYALFGYASGLSGTQGLVMLLVSRVLAGICGANLSVASAYVADITPPEKRSSGVGMVIGMGFGLGFIFGPLIGGLSNHFLGEAAPGWVAASICLFNFIAAFHFGGEPLQRCQTPVKRSQWAQWAHTLKQPKLGILVLLVFWLPSALLALKPPCPCFWSSTWALRKLSSII